MLIRFDDLRPGRRRSFGFADPIDVLTACSPGEVVEVVAAAEAAATTGRWVAGYLAYEAAAGFDPVLVTHPPVPDLPPAWFAVFEQRILDPPWPAHRPYELGLEWEPDQDRSRYDWALAAIHDYIRAGETYQVNHTMRLRSSFRGDAFSAYADLIRAQSGGFGAFLDLGSRQVLSASPELFFRWDEDGITTRPMKGTVRRGRWPEEDARQRSRLAGSEKDHAENLMIVDLLRNDLGRFAEYGSVEVVDLYGIERFDTVWQMTSTIRARPRPDAGLVEVLTGLFPSGSVTGAPKAATMEIIAGLEPTPRGVYCGAIGLLAPPGSGEPRAQFSVAIRTLVVDPAAGSAEYGTGGGITWDSMADAEYEEALIKAAVLTHRVPDFSLLETMRWRPGDGIDRRPHHVRRLRSSAEYFGFPFPARDIAEALDGIDGAEDLTVRLVVSRAAGVTVEVVPVTAAAEPVSLVLDTERVDSRDAMLFHKTTHRAVYDEAAARHPEADDVILINEAGRVTETTRANLAMRFGDEWVTPPLVDGCLPGVLRAELVGDGTLREQSIPVDSLTESDELAVLSSLRGWRRAVLWRAAGSG